MRQLTPIIVAIFVCATAYVYCCDLTYSCEGEVFKVINPDPSLFLDARADGCDTQLSANNTIIAVKNCQTTNVALQLFGIDGESQLCSLSCDQVEQPQIQLSRQRRSAGTAKSLEFILNSRGRRGVANYHCHSSGSVFVNNPRTELFKFSVAEGGGETCKTKHILDNKVVEIYDCPTDGTVMLAVSKKSDLTVQVVRPSNVFVFDCGSTGAVSPVTEGDASGADYQCYADGTISVVNPRTELFRHSHAESNSGECQSLYISGFKKLIIYNCETTGPILLVLARDPITDAQVIRPNNVFLISCS